MDESSLNFITCDQLREEFAKCPDVMNKRILIIDVRDRSSHQKSHLCLDSRNISFNGLFRDSPTLDRYSSKLPLSGTGSNITNSVRTTLIPETIKSSYIVPCAMQQIPRKCPNECDRGDSKKPTRVWSDGCYDMMHFGHANQLRQTKDMGDYLVVGVHSDAEITKHKGPPVFNEEERYKMVRAIKWVDEVVEAAPYITSLETLEKFDCDFCVHGSDITVDDNGLDTYRFVKAAGKYKECQRTIGVSTTDLVERMLDAIGSDRHYSPSTRSSQFLPTTRRIVQFASSNCQGPKQGDKVIYVAGSFDIFHVGHVDFLEKVSKLGDYIIVGLYSDSVISRCKGPKYPIMNLQERVLSVLACKFVNEVIMETPYSISEELMDQFNIDLVCNGKTPITTNFSGQDPFQVAKTMGKYLEVDSGNALTTELVVERIVNKQKDYLRRNMDKLARESRSSN